MIPPPHPTFRLPIHPIPVISIPWLRAFRAFPPLFDVSLFLFLFSTLIHLRLTITWRPSAHSNYMSLCCCTKQSAGETRCFVSRPHRWRCPLSPFILHPSPAPSPPHSPPKVVHCVSNVANNLLHNPGRYTKGQFMPRHSGSLRNSKPCTQISVYKECTMRSRLHQISISRNFIIYGQ